MLPLKNRLLKKKEFEGVFKKGENFKKGFLGLKFINNDLSYNRFGFVVSKKVSPRAVDRNKIKRKLRHLIKEFLPEIKPGNDIVLIVFKKEKEVKKDLINLLKESKLL